MYKKELDTTQLDKDHYLPTESTCRGAFLSSHPPRRSGEKERWKDRKKERETEEGKRDGKQRGRSKEDHDGGENERERTIKKEELRG